MSCTYSYKEQGVVGRDYLSKSEGEREAAHSNHSKLIVARHEDVPVQIQIGDLTDRNDLGTSHEEADVIIIQQMLHLALGGADSMRAICDDILMYSSCWSISTPLCN